MDCRQAGQLLSCQLDDMLSREESCLLAQHLEGCGACRRRLDSLRATVRALGSLPEVEPPPGFRAQWQQALAQHRQAAAQPARRYTAGGHSAWLARLGRSANSGWGRGLIAACLLVAVGLGFWNAGIGPLSTNIALQNNPQIDISQPVGPDESGSPGGSSPDALTPDGKYVPVPDTRADSSPGGAANPGDSDAGPAVPKPNSPTEIISTKVVNQAALEIKVNNYEAAVDRIQRIASSAGPYSLRSASQTSSEVSSTVRQEVVLRVPLGSFQSVLQQITAVGEVSGQSYQAEDIGGEYRSVQQKLERLKCQQEELAQVRPDAAAELEKVNGEIKALETYLDYLGQIDNTGVIKIYLYVNSGPVIP